MTHSTALNYKAIVRILGTILFIIGISMIIPWLYAEFAKEPESARAFRICAPITAVLGFLIMVTIKNHTVKFRSREGYLVVALCWLIASIAGAFPYYISGHAGNFLDAIFESTAGFTTTGCTSINAEYLVLTMTDCDVYINSDTAKSLGIKIPDDVLKKAVDLAKEDL